MFLQLLLFTTTLIITYMETFGIVKRSDFNQVLKIAFVVCCSDEFINTFYRIFRLFTETTGLVVLLLADLFVFACIFRILFYGEKLGDDTALVFSISVSSFWRMFETLMVTTLGGNFPDFIIQAYYINYLYVALLYIFNFISAVIIFGIFAGGFGGKFTEFYTTSVRKVAQKYPEVKEKIK